MSLKKMWDEYSTLIMTIVAAVSTVCGAAIFVGALVIKGMITTQIQTETGQVAAVTTLTTALAVNTNSIQNNTNSIDRVSDQVEEVEGDTKAILLHLAGE